MKIRKITLRDFKRFTKLKIRRLPDTVRLVVLAGPNGCGKSSLFDAFHHWRKVRGGIGHNWENNYHVKSGVFGNNAWDQQIEIEVHGIAPATAEQWKKAFYIRSAYRNEADFALSNLEAVQPSLGESRFARMIDNDSAVSDNYRRLASQAIEDVFDREPGGTTIDQFRERVLGSIRDPFKKVFPALTLKGLGNPLRSGTFKFKKGASLEFLYKNLSGGEKAAFDLISDLVIKLREFNDTVFCIDEPEAHMNTNLQGELLAQLYSLIPATSQLWIATHSIGMLRRSRDIANINPGTVAFLDFGSVDFDTPQNLTPIQPNRAFWENVLRVALDDLADLVAPSQVVICEGAPAGAGGRNKEHDAICYNHVFAEEYPETRFLSGGNSGEVKDDRLALVGAIKALAKGAAVIRLVDRDDHSPTEADELRRQGIKVLNRRHLESYLFDDAVLQALCTAEGQPAEGANLVADKLAAIAECVKQGKPADDIKSAAGMIYTAAKQRLGLVGRANDAKAFQRLVLAPLIKPNMAVYQELKAAIFG